MKSSPLQDDLKLFRKLIKEMKPFVSKKTFYRLKPTQNLKKAYGLVKMHKDGKPLRIIVSSLNSICSGAENYLKNILQNFLPECKYSIESTKKFKTWFMQERKKFEKSDYQIVTLDVVKLYPSVDIEFTLKHVMKKNYENPVKFFSDTLQF